MTLFSKLFGGAKKTPEELATLQEAGAALEALRHERADAQTTLGSLSKSAGPPCSRTNGISNIQALDAEQIACCSSRAARRRGAPHSRAHRRAARQAAPRAVRE